MSLVFLTRDKSAALTYLARSKWNHKLTIVDFSDDGCLKELAENAGVSYFRFITWDSLPDDMELIISCKLNHRIPAFVLERSKYGGINIHPSLLPKYRGANPWFEAYCAHDLNGGVTIHRLSEEVDCGDILIQDSFEIQQGEPLPSVLKKADKVSVCLLEQVLDKVLYKHPGKPQLPLNSSSLNLELNSLKTWNVDRLWHVLRGFPALLQKLFPLPHGNFEVGSYVKQLTNKEKAEFSNGKLICKDGVIELIDFGNSAMTSDYIEAINGRCFGDQSLSTAVFDREIDRTLVYEQGREAIVFPLTLNGKRYALRCMKNISVSDVYDYAGRMSSIAMELAKSGIKHFIGFRVIEKAFRTNKGFFPAILMEYYKGLTLDQYLLKHLGNQPALRNLLNEFVGICNINHQHGIGHGDLHGGNLRIDCNGRIKILDIGHLYVGGVDTHSDGGADRLWQHPLRTINKYFFDGIDNFSEIVIYVNILVAMYAPDLYRRFLLHGNIFKIEDYNAPDQSHLLEAVEGVPELEGVVGKFRKMVQVADIREIMSLENFIDL